MEYDVFISYARSSDRLTAGRLRDGLLHLGRKWNRRRALKVFMDRTSLRAGRGLKSSLEAVLDQTRHLIVLASPASAQSPWVTKEIERWLEKRSTADDISLVVTDGDVSWDESTNDFDWDTTTAIGKVLSRAYAEEPIYVDLRWAQGRADLDIRSNLQFRDDVATIAAAFHEMSKEDLVGLDLQQFRRAKRLRKGAVSGLIVLALAASLTGAIAYRSAQIAEKQAAQARSRQLAAQSMTTGTDRLDLGALLSIEALRSDSTPEAYGSLVNSAFGALDVMTYLNAHTEAVTSVAFDEDGTTLATGGRDDTVVLWDMETTNAVSELTSAVAGDVQALAFSPTASVLASAGLDELVHLWDVSERSRPSEVSSLEGHEGGVYSIAYSADGRYLASGGTDGAIRVWDVADPRDPQPATTPLMGHDKTVRSLAFSPTTGILASGGLDGRVALWDLDRERPIAVYDHGAEVGAVSFTRDGRRLASGGWDGVVRVWDVSADGRVLAPRSNLEEGDDIVRSVAFSPDGTTLAAGSRANRVALWNPSTQERRVLSPDHAGEVWSVDFSPDGRVLATAGADGKVILRRTGGPFRSAVRLVDGTIRGVAVDPAQDLIVAAGDSRLGMYWYRLEESSVEQTALSAEVVAIDIAPDGHVVATGDRTGQVSLWDARTHRSLGTLAGSASIVQSVSFDPSGRFLAAGFHDGAVVVWERPAGEDPVERRFDVGGTVWDLDFSPDGSWLAMTTGADSFMMWHVGDEDEERVTVAGETLTSLAFDPSGSVLAIGRGDGTIELVDVAARRPLRRSMTGHQGTVQDLEFVGSGALLASAGQDGTVILWNVATGLAIADPLGDSSGPTLSLRSLHDGTILVTGGHGGVQIWDVRPQTLTDTLCRVANRNLTVQEWDAYVGSERDYRKSCPDLP